MGRKLIYLLCTSLALIWVVLLLLLAPKGNAQDDSCWVLDSEYGGLCVFSYTCYNHCQGKGYGSDGECSLFGFWRACYCYIC